VENWLWKRLWTGRQTDCGMNEWMDEWENNTSAWFEYKLSYVCLVTASFVNTGNLRRCKLFSDRVASGQWTVVNGQWTMDSGHWTVDSGQWTVNSGHWALDSGQ